MTAAAAEIYRPCEGCGRDLVDFNRREGARFCSGSCRQRAWRQRRSLSTVPDPQKSVHLDSEITNPQVRALNIRNAQSTLDPTKDLTVTPTDPQVIDDVNVASRRSWWAWLRERSADDWKEAKKLHQLRRDTGRYPWE